MCCLTRCPGLPGHRCLWKVRALRLREVIPLKKGAFIAAMLVAFFLNGKVAFCAIEATGGLQGVTGIVNVPNAEVLPDGMIELSSSNQIDPRWRHTSQKRPLVGVPREESYWLNLGVFPYLEGGFRLTEAPNQARDLSANVKLQLPVFPEWGPRLAVGGQDIAGAVPFFRTFYAAASQRFFDRLRLTVGYGVGPDHLKGRFGGVELKLHDTVALLADHDGLEGAAALRLSTMDGWLPWNLRLSTMFKTSLEYRAGEKYDLGVTLTLPLGNDDRTRLVRLQPEESASTASMAEATQASPAPVTDPVRDQAKLASIYARLVALGFTDPRVGIESGDCLVVAFENRRFNHNELDGLGIVLGIVLEEASSSWQSFRLRLKNYGLTIVDVRGSVADFIPFMTGKEETLSQSQISRLREQIHLRIGTSDAVGEVVWYEGGTKPARNLVEVVLYPSIRNAIGTEIGVYDYALSLKGDAFLHLWPGATVNLRGDYPLRNSENYDEGEYFNRDGEVTEKNVDRFMINQAMPLGKQALALFSVGKYNLNQSGFIGDLMWHSRRGEHRFEARAARLKDDYDQSQNAMLGGYRYFWAPYDVSFELTGGQFLGGDHGGLLTVTRFYGDASAGFYYQETEEQIAGVRFSFPLTPPKDMKPLRLQIRGVESWPYSLETALATGEDRNFIRFGLGQIPTMYHSLERVYYNSGRISESYLHEHLLRLREAYQRWGKEAGL